MPATRHHRPWVVLICAVALTGCSSAPTTPPGSPPPSSGAAPGSPTASPASPSASPSADPSTSASRAATVDGQIVFADAGDNFEHSQVWIENADGSNVRKIVSDAFTDSAVSLSPDGSKVVFYRAMPDANDIVVVNVDGSNLHELDPGVTGYVPGVGGCDAGPEGDAWSPDGTRIAYAIFCFDKGMNLVRSGIWTVKVDGTDAREVTHHGPAKFLGHDVWEPHLEDHRAGWSPDGNQLAFERIDTSTTPERAAIYTIGVNGKGLRQVTPWKLDGNDPDWSPDGKVIAFNSPAEPSPTQNIWTIRPDGTGAAQLTTYNESGQATFHPSWSPDGTQILFSHNPSTDGWADFFVMNGDGSDQHVIAHTALHENQGQWGRSPSP